MKYYTFWGNVVREQRDENGIFMSYDIYDPDTKTWIKNRELFDLFHGTRLGVTDYTPNDIEEVTEEEALKFIERYNNK